jgi:hypothetical protein
MKSFRGVAYDYTFRGKTPPLKSKIEGLFFGLGQRQYMVFIDAYEFNTYIIFFKFLKNIVFIKVEMKIYIKNLNLSHFATINYNHSLLYQLFLYR